MYIHPFSRQLLRRRAALIALSQLGVGLTAAACTSSTGNNSPTSKPVATPGAVATVSSAQNVASPAAKPATSPVAAGSPSASANPAASPVSGAAPLPVPLPTQGGPPPTVVGTSSTPAPQPNATGAFSPEGAASPVASPAIPVASPSAQPAATVMMTPDHRFDPQQVSVSVGQTVVWRNTSRNPQTVTCDPSLVSDPSHVSLPAGAEPIDSGVINTNTTYSHTFDTPGNYQYVSLPFEQQNMFGTVTVQG